MSTRRVTSTHFAMPALHPALPSLAAFFIVIGVLAAAVMGAFRVRQVNVIGANLPVTQIVDATGASGQNIFTVASDRIVERLSRIPSIEVDRVVVSFPDTVSVYARARPAYAVWQRGKVSYLLDAAGAIIGQSAATTGLPLIVDVDVPSPPSFGTLQAVRYADITLPRLPDGAQAPAEMYRKFGLVLVGRSGWHAVLGSGSPQTLGARVATLAALLKRAANLGQQVLYTNLTYTDPLYCQRTATPCQSLPREFGGTSP